MGKTSKVRSSFEEYTHLLKEYIKKYHKLPLKKEVYADKPLGVWCCTQKYLYRKGKLDPAKIKLLKPTGLLDTGMYNFQVRVRAIDAFYQKYNRFPFQNEIVRGKPLGWWWYQLQEQIWRYSLSDTEMEYLEQTVPYMIKLGRNKDLNQYWEWIDLLKEYQAETGRIFPKTREIYKGKQLGAWYIRQKQKGKQGKLTENQKDILASVGFIFPAFSKNIEQETSCIE